MTKKYEIRLTQAIQYIDDNLVNKISLDDVARASHFSAFHFHRIFSALVGETVNDYISRRKLERAVNKLVFEPDKSITEVALENGFSSGANFAKAVKIHFGFSPSQIRNPQKNKNSKNSKNSKIGKILSKYGKDFDPNDLYPNRTANEVNTNPCILDLAIKVKIVDLNEKRVCTLASLRGYEQQAVFDTWDKLSNWAIVNGIKSADQHGFAFCFDHPAVTPIDKCRYEYALVIDDEFAVESPFKSALIPQGKYASLYLKGSPEAAKKAQLGLYADWLPNSGFEPDDFPMLEHYFNDLRVDGYLEMETLIKLKTLT
ncbi:MAG: AraC family transcriptional regulator [Algicola sp.]|nr:AraC family transcriptional regulator [Algicola sp.]